MKIPILFHKKIRLGALALLLGSPVLGQAQVRANPGSGSSPDSPIGAPASYRVPLGSAAVYGLLSGGTLAARDLVSTQPDAIVAGPTTAVDIPVQVLGSAGASQRISSGVLATSGLFAQGSGTVPQALADLQRAKAYCASLNGRGLSGQLAGQVLTGGVYTVFGDAELGSSTPLVVSGDTATIVILNITGSLAAQATSQVTLRGVLPRHVYWNIGGTLSIGDAVAFAGVALVSASAIVDGIRFGNYAILSEDDIVLTHSSPTIGHNLFYAPAGTAATCSGNSSTCSSARPGSELIVNGSFESKVCCPTNNSGLISSDLYDYAAYSYSSDACYWVAPNLFGTSDYFNKCATATDGMSAVPIVGVPYNKQAVQNGTTAVAVPALAANSRATTGEAYAGIYAWQTSSNAPYREYLCQVAPGTLQRGKHYYGEFSAHIAPSSGSTVPQLGMVVAPYLSINYPNAYGNSGIIPLTPTIAGNPNLPPASGAGAVAMGWKRVGQAFEATDDITAFVVLVGNFNGTAVTSNGPGQGSGAYYYLDNVSLSPLTEAGPDVTLTCTQLVQATAVTLGTTPMPAVVAATYQWTAAPADPSLTDPTSPNPTVHPTQPTTYTLTVTIDRTASGAPTDKTVYTTQAQVLAGAPTYSQNTAATYVAPAGLAAYEIGTSGLTTTLDASQSPYGTATGNKVVFDGRYHVRGKVRLTNGTFELRPGTEFLVEGASGLTGATDNSLTTIELANATCNVTGASLQAVCTDEWGGVVLAGQASLHTAASGTRRSLIRDAQYGVASSAGNTYYLAGTDFIHNQYGLRDQPGNKTALTGEGVQNCTFSLGDFGLLLSEGEYHQGVTYGGNYDAATFSNNSFDKLLYGLEATAGKGHFTANSFTNCYFAAMNAYGVPQAGPAEFKSNTITVPSVLPTLAPYVTAGGAQQLTATYVQGIYSSDATLLLTNNVVQGDNTNPTATAIDQIGIEVNFGGSGVITGNTLNYLDEGIINITNSFDGSSHDIQRNSFTSNVTSLLFFPWSIPSTPMAVTAVIRCNSFLNPSANVGYRGIWVKNKAGFSNTISNNGTGNGNKFLSADWTGNNALVNDSPIQFNYTAYNRDEAVGSIHYSNGAQGAGTVTTAGSPPLNGCGGVVGVNVASPNPTSSSLGILATKLDSLQRSDLAIAQRQRLLAAIVAQPNQPAYTAALEAYAATAAEPRARQAIRLHLLQGYRQQHDQANAARLRTGLWQQRPANDEELAAYLHFTDVLDHLGNPHLGRLLAGADRALLAQVALSGTTTARLACRLLRQYEPACPCQLSAGLASETLAAAGRRLGQGLGQPAYPNPASTWLRVPYTLPAGTPAAELVAYDGLGRVVLRQALRPDQGEASVAVQGWAPGLYQLTLVVGGQVAGTQRVAIISPY